MKCYKTKTRTFCIQVKLSLLAVCILLLVRFSGVVGLVQMTMQSAWH